MGSFYYATAADRLAVTWALDTGTARTGYEVANLNALPGLNDPSLPLWILENSIRITADLGSDKVLVGAFIFAHTFDAALNVRFQANASNSWGAPTLSQPLTINSPYNKFTCHAGVDLRTALPNAIDRTFRYISIANLSANSKTVAIGEVWIVTAYAPLGITREFSLPKDEITVSQDSRRGVQTVYGLGSRRRDIAAKIRLPIADASPVLDWQDTQQGNLNLSVVQLDATSSERRLSEPRLCRFTGMQDPTAVNEMSQYEVSVNLQEVGQGEPVNA
jgi:hypothetical protein